MKKERAKIQVAVRNVTVQSTHVPDLIISTAIGLYSIQNGHQTNCIQTINVWTEEFSAKTGWVQFCPKFSFTPSGTQTNRQVQWRKNGVTDVTVTLLQWKWGVVSSKNLKVWKYFVLFQKFVNTYHDYFLKCYKNTQFFYFTLGIYP